MPVVVVAVKARKKAQLALDFRPGLVSQFPDWHDLIAHVVYGSRIGLAGVAAHLDRSPSELSRMLNKNPDDPRNLPDRDVVLIIEATGDHRPVYWLIERFLEDPQAKRDRAREDLAALVPQLKAVLAELGE